jgi:hypothetical protein
MPFVFNAPPGWPVPEDGWQPPPGWKPDPAWPPAPPGWSFWVPAAEAPPASAADDDAHEEAAAEPAHPVAAETPLADAHPIIEPPRSDPTVSAPGPPIDSRSTVEQLERRIAELEAELRRAREAAGSELVDLDDHRVLQEEYHHPLENAAAYKDALAELNAQIREMVKARDAVLASDMFTFNNSLAKGRRMTAEFSKLMLRAYNAEADNCVRSLRAGNVVSAKKRLDASVAAIAKLGAMMEMRINPDYHALRIRELKLTADYLMKVQVEREEAREERERLREERRAEQELAAERARLDKEREHYANALRALEGTDDIDAISELNERLAEIDQAIAQNDFRAANIRAGYVYVISNPGALGPNVVKIGMTRRLEPMDRVRELGDASVPFPFDVHALFFSEDAVAVEAELHRSFADRRVNLVNQRREFFFATPAEVREVLLESVGNLLEFTDEPEATQFMQSRKYWPAGIAGPIAPS